MNHAGVTRKRSNAAISVVALLLAVAVVGVVVAGGTAKRGLDPLISVIVRETSDASNEPERALRHFGGHVRQRIGLLHGFSAALPRSRVAALTRVHGVLSVTPDARVRLMTAGSGTSSSSATMYNVTKSIGAQDVWGSGITGRGIDIALIDSGVTPVKGLGTGDKVIYGPDLSFESQADNLRHLDTFGHGTHMASIMAGRDPDNPYLNGDNSGNSVANPNYFNGVAPDARVVSLKVSSADGATDVSQVIAAIDWVVEHGRTNGLNVRVLNLSFGTDSVQSYLLDPLAYAAEVAWHRGIVVVVAAGNAGFGSPMLNDPAYDPYVIAVGANDMMGTVEPKDDVNALFSSTGDTKRRPDISAPGKSIEGLRVAGSFLDNANPNARVQSRLFKGSGTSQSAAIVSGAAALILHRRPNLNPDQVKKLITSTAVTTKSVPGAVDVKRANGANTPSTTSALQSWPRATGLGSLELSRGTVHVSDQGVELRGEYDIFGQPFVSATWAPLAASGSTWSGGTWNGSTWSGSTWSGSTWSGSTWSGSTWSGSTWSGSTWSGSTWSATTWSGSTWSGSTWSGSTWSAGSWCGSTWSGGAWSTGGWLGVTWGK